MCTVKDIPLGISLAWEAPEDEIMAGALLTLHATPWEEVAMFIFCLILFPLIPFPHYPSTFTFLSDLVLDVVSPLTMLCKCHPWTCERQFSQTRFPSTARISARPPKKSTERLTTWRFYVLVYLQIGPKPQFVGGGHRAPDFFSSLGKDVLQRKLCW